VGVVTVMDPKRLVKEALALVSRAGSNPKWKYGPQKVSIA